MKLSFLQSHEIGRMVGNDCEFSSLSIDTRTLKRGDLFVALKGKNFNGHEFIGQAKSKGACGFVIEKEQSIELPQLLVSNSVEALGKIGALNRSQFSGKVIAVTGSCGKTTVKGMLQSICNQSGTCVATRGNLNNHIGVPLTLMELKNPCDFAIVEAGTSGVGEIGYLATLIQPNIAVVINVMPAHLEGFGTIDAIAVEKSAIYGNKSEATLPVVNLDDKSIHILMENIGSRNFVGFTTQKREQISINFSSCSGLISIESMSTDTFGRTNFTANIGDEIIFVKLNVVGPHNLQNALASIAAAWAAGVSPNHIKAGLELYKGVNGRMQVLSHPCGASIIDDTYNANPGSMKAAIDFLAAQEKSFLVCGDMGELGDQSKEFHSDIGRYAKRKGIQHVYSVGDEAKAISMNSGLSGAHFSSKQDLLKKLIPMIESNSVILVKGSRNTKMETLVEMLMAAGVSN